MWWTIDFKRENWNFSESRIQRICQQRCFLFVLFIIVRLQLNINQIFPWMVDKTTIVHWYRIYMAKNLNSDVVKSRVWHKLIHKRRTITSCSWCLKITEKVSFNIASEASYIYILSGQKLIKNAKNGQIWRVLENLKLAVKQSYHIGQF